MQCCVLRKFLGNLIVVVWQHESETQQISRFRPSALLDRNTKQVRCPPERRGRYLDQWPWSCRYTVEFCWRETLQIRHVLCRRVKSSRCGTTTWKLTHT